MTNLNMALETAHGVSSASELISFNKIPNEIISTILLLSMPDHKNDDLPRSVSMVCKRWKDVVFSTPFAWSNIHITDYSILPRIRRCLERSRNVPLLIEVATNVVQHSSSFLEVVRILAPHTDRWKNMTLAMDHRYASWNLWLKLTNGPGASYSQLEVIKICGTDLYVDEERRSMDILDMPRLRSVDLQCVPSAFLRPFLSPTVKTIMLAGIWASTDVICHAISHCSELASLSITGCHLPESITIPRSSTSLFTPNRDAGEYIIFPNLTNIGFGGSEWNDFFIRIKAPSLVSLTIFGVTDCSDILMKWTEWAHKLAILNVTCRCDRFTPSDMILWLQLNPRLFFFTIGGDLAATTICESLSRPDPQSGDWLCPGMNVFVWESDDPCGQLPETAAARKAASECKPRKVLSFLTVGIGEGAWKQLSEAEQSKLSQSTAYVDVHKLGTVSEEDIDEPI